MQRPADSATGHYAFIGGEYELGDTFEERVRKEFEEETTARVLSSEYRFVVENHFLWNGELVQTLEHYFEVELDTIAVTSREPQLEQIWLDHATFAAADVRPLVVRDVLLTSGWRDVRRLTVSL